MLFAERVRKVLRGPSLSINYDEYTYGKLINVCTQEGLVLCNEIKLNQQVKKYCLNERQQLGEFCEQFVIDIPRSAKEHYRHKKKKFSQGRKAKRIEKKYRRKRDYKTKKDFIKSTKTNARYRCGRVGHFAKDCKVKEKINSLMIDEEIKDFVQDIP